MKKVKLLLIGCILIFTLALGGCMRVETAFVVDESNSLTLNVKYAFNKEKAYAALEEMAKETGETIKPEEFFTGLSEETINGEQYYVDKASQAYTQKDLEQGVLPAVVSKDKFYLYAGTDTAGSIDDSSNELVKELESMGLSLEDIEYIEISVKLPAPIVKTNGVIQEDQTTAVWNFTDQMDQQGQEYEIYAYTANVTANPAADREMVLARINSQPTQTPASGNPSNKPSVSKDTKAPVIKGIKKNKAYKKKVVVYVKDDQKLKKVTVNGKKAKLTKVKKGKYKGYFKFTVKKKGKKTIVAYDAAGNKKKVNIKIK